MSENIGKIGWIDMTVDDATELRDFYAEVVGWNVEDTSMGDYSDYTMMSPGDGAAISGICHSRGSNADLPGGWPPPCQPLFFIAPRLRVPGSDSFPEPADAGGAGC